MSKRIKCEFKICQECGERKNTTKTKPYYYCEDCEEAIVAKYDECGGFTKNVVVEPSNTFIKVGSGFILGAVVTYLVMLL